MQAGMNAPWSKTIYSSRNGGCTSWTLHLHTLNILTKTRAS